MTKVMRLASLLGLVVALLVAGKITPALAAPALPEVTTTPGASITGIVTNIEIVKHEDTGLFSVKVTYTDVATSATGTLDLSLDAAKSLNLITLDASGQPVVNAAMIGQQVTFDASLITPTPTPTETENQNPVAAVIAKIFGLDYQTVAGYHDAGAGYGVIAQACWLSYELKGDTSMCADILKAKQSGDFSTLTLPDGTTASNWGQFIKAVYGQGHKHNLGELMSGRATPIVPGGTVTPTPPPVDGGFVIDQGNNPGSNHPGPGQNGNHGNGGSQGRHKGWHK